VSVELPAQSVEERSDRAGSSTDTSYLEMDLDLDTLTTSVASRPAPEVEQVPHRRQSWRDTESDSELDIDLGELAFQSSDSPASGESGSDEAAATARHTEAPQAGPDLFSLDAGEEDAGSVSWQQDSGLWDEVATKLDLARAYLDMQDRDAARVILDEVAAEGNDAQRSEAKQLLEQLG